MADVQLEKGHFSFANTLWEAIHKYDFPRQEKKLLEEVWRLTYGCKKEKDGSDGRYCIVDEWQQLAAASCLDPGAFSRMLKSLTDKRVLYVSKKYKVIVFNKDPDTWIGVSVFKTYNDQAHRDLIKRNLNYTEVDKALGNAMYEEMKKEWRLDAESSDLTQSQVTCLPIKNSLDAESSDLTKNQVKLDAESSETADKANVDVASDASKRNIKEKNIYIYTDLLEKLEFLPGIIDISKSIDKEYFEYIKAFDAEMIDPVLAEAQRRTKLKSGDRDKLQRKSVLKFIAGGLENYDKLYASKQPAKKLTPKERAVAQGIKIIQAYQVHPDMIQSKRQLSSLIRHYDEYEDYGELVNMTLEQVNQAIGEE